MLSARPWLQNSALTEGVRQLRAVANIALFLVKKAQVGPGAEMWADILLACYISFSFSMQMMQLVRLASENTLSFLAASILTANPDKAEKVKSVPPPDGSHFWDRPLIIFPRV